ncbi:hypothetical protein [Streptomyces litchfieldiae]|uniref:Uncharacterized protein n=1 Tax=Streptomyces litchfieldiae TaxID=3075543 RepID=A0ABU2N195_9ACTN|nr:hypothetical protein [Streptomyces sp. DSM 44938]MDT0347545.1 hypothetical protein [Streptomyces sp. DSM 44938]
MPEYDPRDLAPTRPYYPEQMPTPPGPLAHPHSPSPAFEAAYRQRVDELLAAEQMLLALRARQAAALHAHQGMVVPGGYGPYPPAPATEPVPARARAFATYALSGGGAVALGGIGLRAAQPALAQAAELATGLGTLGVLGAGAWLLLRGTRTGRTDRDGARTEVHLHRGARVKIRNLHNHNR